MDLTCVPDLGIVIPPDDMPYATLQERVQAACKTIEELVMHGLDPETMHATEEDTKVAQDLLLAHAEDDDKTRQSVTPGKLATLKPAIILQLDEMLGEFSHSVVKNAVQIRTFVTNKLLLEASNPDPRVRIRALELLGKISDVGLFTERSEVTINHRSTEDLRKSLREKLEILREKALPQDVVDVTPVRIPSEDDSVPLVEALDAELGARE